MSSPTYPMRRALHLRLQAGLDDLDVASMLHGVPVDRLRCFELGEVELAPHELAELAAELSRLSSWAGDPGELRELVDADGAPFDVVGDTVQVRGVIREALTAEHERRLALAGQTRELLDALPPATDPLWVQLCSLWHAAGDREVCAQLAAGVARDADAGFEPFLHELSAALRVRRAA